MWDTLDKIATVAQITTFVVFIAGITLLLTRVARYKRRVKKALQIGKGLRVALAVSLKPGENVKGHVETYLKEKGIVMDISEINANGVSLNTMHKLRNDFIKKKRELSDKGVSEVHLFYEGPVATAFFLADVLNNWVPVYVYHFHRDGGYECWGLLTESLERMATEELIREVAKDA
ncbi:MAG: SAVED domain-containing protein [Nitrospinota bacterium]